MTCINKDGPHEIDEERYIAISFMFIFLLLPRGPHAVYLHQCDLSIIYRSHQFRYERVDSSCQMIVHFLAREIDNNFELSRVFLFRAERFRNTCYFYVFVLLAVSSKVIGGNELHQNAMEFLPASSEEWNYPVYAKHTQTFWFRIFALTYLKFSASPSDFDNTSLT